MYLKTLKDLEALDDERSHTDFYRIDYSEYEAFLDSDNWEWSNV